MTDRPRKHTQPLSPVLLWDVTDSIIETLEDIRKEYKDAHSYAHGFRDRPTDENKDEKVTGSHLSDPTGDVATSQIGNRKRLRNASNDLERIRDRVLKVLKDIEKVSQEDEDEYQPLSAYVPPSSAKRHGDAMQKRRDLREQEQRYEGKLAGIRRKMERV